MYPLSTAEAKNLVRKNFDEVVSNDSDMVGLDDLDSNNFEDTLVRTLPEAINAVHAMAPANMLTGKTLDSDEALTPANSNGVLSFGIKGEILRLVAFKASDSYYVVTELTPEYSTEGRMQLNPYTCGSPERPRLVLCQGGTNVYYDKDETVVYKTNFRYYTTTDTVVKRFEYIERYHYVASKQSYDVCENVVQNVIDHLTGLMFAIYGNDKMASYFFQKASFTPAPAQDPAVSE